MALLPAAREVRTVLQNCQGPRPTQQRLPVDVGLRLGDLVDVGHGRTGMHVLGYPEREVEDVRAQCGQRVHGRQHVAVNDEVLGLEVAMQQHLRSLRGDQVVQELLGDSEVGQVLLVPGPREAVPRPVDPADEVLLDGAEGMSRRVGHMQPRGQVHDVVQPVAALADPTQEVHQHGRGALVLSEQPCRAVAPPGSKGRLLGHTSRHTGRHLQDQLGTTRTAALDAQRHGAAGEYLVRDQLPSFDQAPGGRHRIGEPQPRSGLTQAEGQLFEQ